MWPEYVKDRIRTTYMYFGGSVMLTAASAMACFRSPIIMKAVMGNSWMVCFQSWGCKKIKVCSITLFNAGNFGQHCCHDWYRDASSQYSIPTRGGVETGCLGSPFGRDRRSRCPIMFSRWPTASPCCSVKKILKASNIIVLFNKSFFSIRYTAGIVGGLSTVAVCAPSEKFLNMGGPLAIGFGAVFAASLGSELFLLRSCLSFSFIAFSVFSRYVLAPYNGARSWSLFRRPLRWPGNSLKNKHILI